MSENLKLVVKCPLCGSQDVLYSCEPRCCFNHVCTVCKASFLTATEPHGGKVASFAIAPRESGEPTARCCQCRSIDVVTMQDGGVACASCGALLNLTFLDVEKR